ncbi:MAG: restriction endonuclease subunit R [Cyanobacteria bacterium P01_G01_bin.54]
MSSLTARTTPLVEFEDRFDLQLTEDPGFFWEWQGELPDLSEVEQARCDRIRTSFLYLLRYPPLLENTVKMVVLSPLLDMAGFYLPPFHLKSEQSTEITSQDDELKVMGNLDVLVLCEQIWLLVIESKQAAFSLEVGRAQILSYLLAAPKGNQPVYGLLTNGSHFTFLKLLKRQQQCHYALSSEFVMRNSEASLQSVLKILKSLATVVQQRLSSN